jgi:integrase/recombinase XerD
MKVRDAIERYIVHKRNDGVLYRNQGTRLRSFGRYLGDIELQQIDTAQILAFLNGSKVSTYTWRSKYAQLARFFKYWQVFGVISAMQMPAPRGLARQTFVPYVYSRPEIRALLQATSQVRQNANAMIHPETFRMLLLLLYATGARISEATALLAEDVDLKNRTMRLRLHGHGSPRTLPIGPDLWRILNRYSKWTRSMHLDGKLFLLRRDGSRLDRCGVYRLFHKLLKQAGVARRDRPLYRPRIRDFRPTFAVHQITSWIRKGMNLNRLLPALSGYLGQMDLNSTDQFLLLTPERFKRELDKLSPQQGERWSANPETMKFLSSL